MDDTKPRDDWDGQDWADYLDGWHEGADEGFRSKRDASRPVQVTVRNGAGARVAVREHPAAVLQDLGRRGAHERASRAA